MQRRAFLGSGFGQKQRPGREVQGRQTQASRNASAFVLPLEAAGNHQMDNEEEAVIEFQNDLFAEAAQCLNGPATDGRDRRSDGPDDKRAGQAHAL